MYNLFIWNRHRYYVGAIDVKSGKIVECHTFKQMADADHHTDFAFSYEQGSAINEGKSISFIVDNNKIVLDDYAIEEFHLENMAPILKEQIMKQIKIIEM